jgi:hypothetical protein
MPDKRAALLLDQDQLPTLLLRWLCYEEGVVAIG